MSYLQPQEHVTQYRTDLLEVLSEQIFKFHAQVIGEWRKLNKGQNDQMKEIGLSGHVACIRGINVYATCKL